MSIPATVRPVVASQRARTVALPASSVHTARRRCVDGNYAAAHSAYAMSDCAFVFPITPSTAMAQHVEEWSAQGRKSVVWGRPVMVRQMQSEAGVAGALHGALRSGALATTFTSSQGLLLMVPALFKMAGESLPLVIHLASRALSEQTVTIFPDHSDVYAVRQTGAAILSSSSVQDIADLSLVAHVAAIKSSTPFVHFFEGMQLSHEMASVELPTDAEIASVAPLAEAEAFRRRAALDPARPVATGVVVGRDTFWQHAEADNARVLGVPRAVSEAMRDVARATGRPAHSPFEYVGHARPDRVAIVMGAGSGTVERAVQRLCARGERVGVLKVHLWRPWSDEMFLSALPRDLPPNARVVVLDRARELGAGGEPLFLDVVATLARAGHPAALGAIGARYGVGGFEFSVEMAEAVFKEAARLQSMGKGAGRRFAVGIDDDVTHLSLPLSKRTPSEGVPPGGDGTTRCVTWGVGGDGAIAACKAVAQIMSDGKGEEAKKGKQNEVFSQAVFEYGAHKNGGLTVSHVRFGPHQVSQHAGIGPGEADWVVCHVPRHLSQYGVPEQCREGGSLLLNVPAASAAELRAALPTGVLRRIAQRKLRVWAVDASRVARESGAGHISLGLAMQAALLRASRFAGENGPELLKRATSSSLGQRSADADLLVKSNAAAVDNAVPKLIEYPTEEWAGLPEDKEQPGDNVVEDGDGEHGSCGGSCSSSSSGSLQCSGGNEDPDYVRDIVRPLQRMAGADIPVSTFLKYSPQGCTPAGTAAFEKRGVAENVPEWDPARCIQCNRCSFVCPHTALRSVVYSDGAQGVPAGLPSQKAQGADDKRFRIQNSPLDCTGCGACAEVCPTKSIKMKPFTAHEVPNWKALVEKRAGQPKKDPEAAAEPKKAPTVKTLASRRPGLEFAGSCVGCAQPVYVRTLTQVVGPRLVVANGVGCSTVWGGTAYTNPYTRDPDTGRGVSWACSLLEDAAEFGYGAALGARIRRDSLRKAVAASLGDTARLREAQAPEELVRLLREWLTKFDDADESLRLHGLIEPRLEAIGEARGRALLDGAWEARDLFARPSHWVVGGDGWAYDIGYGGVDHVLSTGEPLKMLVLDNENYANTGGQTSRATPAGAVTKLGSSGKRSVKRDLGLQAALNGNAYVASVCYGANSEQTIRAIAEAEAFPGPAVVLCYCPCIEHGIKGGLAGGAELAHMREAVTSGYWPLFRFDPRRAAQGLAPLQFDQPFRAAPATAALEKFLRKEGRFEALARANAALAGTLHKSLAATVSNRIPLLRAASDAVLAAQRSQTTPTVTEVKPKGKK